MMAIGKYFKTGAKYLGIICLVFVMACNHGGQKKSGNSNDSLKITNKENAYLESVYYRFPTPNEIFGFINNEKLRFNEALLNPATNADKYMESKGQTVALGTYVADLAYITLFEAYNKSIQYYKIIHGLSEKINITSAYDNDVAKRIEKNLLNLDSLKNISVDSYSSMVEYLIVSNREKTLALIAAGSYIECFYIAFNLAGDYNPNNPMITKIVDLKYAFDNLYSYLQIYSDDRSVKAVAVQFKGLNELFKKIKEKSIGKTTVKQDANGNLILGGGTKLEMDQKLYNDLRNEIFKLRANLIISN